MLLQLETSGGRQAPPTPTIPSRDRHPLPPHLPRLRRPGRANPPGSRPAWRHRRHHHLHHHPELPSRPPARPHPRAPLVAPPASTPSTPMKARTTGPTSAASPPIASASPGANLASTTTTPSPPRTSNGAFSPTSSPTSSPSRSPRSPTSRATPAAPTSPAAPPSPAPACRSSSAAAKPSTISSPSSAARAWIPPAFVFHCFTGTPADMRSILDFGAMVSFTGIVTYRNAADIQEAAGIGTPSGWRPQVMAPRGTGQAASHGLGNGAGGVESGWKTSGDSGSRRAAAQCRVSGNPMPAPISNGFDPWLPEMGVSFGVRPSRHRAALPALPLSGRERDTGTR